MDLLIIDDNKPFAEAMAGFLRNQGLKVDCCFSTDQALQRNDETGPRIVLASHSLPGSGSLKVATHFSARYPVGTAVFLLSSARITAGLQRQANEAGARGFIRKTSGPRTLYERLVSELKALGPAPRPAVATSVPVAAEPAAPPASSSEGTSAATEPAAPKPAAERPRTRSTTAMKGDRNRQILQALHKIRRRNSEPAAPDAQEAAPTPSASASADPLPIGGGGAADDGEKHFNEGLVLLEYDNYRAAAKQFGQAWSLNPNKPHYLAYKARAQYLAGGAVPDPKGDLADDFRLAMTLDPACAPAHRFLGEIYLDAGQMEKARDSFIKALKLSPDDADLRKLIGKAKAPRA